MREQPRPRLARQPRRRAEVGEESISDPQDVVAEISPRLIIGKNVYRTETKLIRELIARIEEGMRGCEVTGSRGLSPRNLETS